MNTFFTVWFLVNGFWMSNTVYEGWDAYNLQTEARCEAAVKYSANEKNRILPGVPQRFTCEKDGEPRQVAAK